MKAYRNCIFDLYGTLADIHTDETKNSFWKAVKDFYASEGALYEGKELKEAYLRYCAKEEHRISETGRHKEIDLYPVFERLYRSKGVSADEDLVRKTALFWRKASTSHLRLYSGVKELFEELRRNGRKIFLLSNAQSLFTVPELELLGIKDCFDDILISSDTGYKKPDPFFLEILLKRNRLRKEDCILIGNDLSSDILCAKLGGIDSYYVHSALSPKAYPEELKEKAVPTDSQDRMDLKLLRRRLLS